MARNPFKQPNEVTPVAPAIVMYDPRYPHNAGAAMRGASCYGIGQIWIAGERTEKKVLEANRLPREERMKGFQDVSLVRCDRPFDYFEDAVPVAVELLRGSENLLTFEHPENAIYVFGPEDGSIPGQWRGHCHRRVFIPTSHCLNLGVAVNTILYDRLFKQYMAGDASIMTMEECLFEDRGRYEGWTAGTNPNSLFGD